MRVGGVKGRGRARGRWLALGLVGDRQEGDACLDGVRTRDSDFRVCHVEGHHLVFLL